METLKIDVNKQIQVAIKTGKISLGLKEAAHAARSGKAKLIIVAANCPEPHRTNIIHWAGLSKLPVFEYAASSLDLGVACGKRFFVSALTVREEGSSEILKLAEH